MCVRSPLFILRSRMGSMETCNSSYCATCHSEVEDVNVGCVKSVCKSTSTQICYFTLLSCEQCMYMCCIIKLVISVSPMYGTKHLASSIVELQKEGHSYHWKWLRESYTAEATYVRL